MRDALKIFDRYVNENQIAKITKTKFLNSFLNGSEFYDDFIFLKDELPEYLDSFSVIDNWQDGKYHKYIDDSYCFFTNSSNLILGEIKFLGEKPIFAKFNKNGMFSTFDTFLIHNNKVFKGSIPYSEIGKYYDQSKRDWFGFEMRTIKNDEVFSIERFKYSNFVDFCYKIGDKKIIFKTNLSDENDFAIYIQKFITNKINTDYLTKKVDSNDEYFKKDIVPYIKKIIEMYYLLDNNNFKKDELITYFKIYDIFENHLKNYKYKIKKEE